MLPPLRRRLAHRYKTALRRKVGPAIFCLGLLCTPAICADNASAPSPVPTPDVVVTSHLTDGQDRMGTGKLSPKAEAKSRANALYTEAMLSLEDPKNNLQASLAELRQVAALDPHFTDAQVEIANLLLQLGQLSAALEQLQTAAAANPHSIDIEAALAYVQRLRGQNEEAVRLAKEALTKNPSQVTAMRVMLEVAGDQNDLAGGVLHVEDILKSNGSNVPASSWLMLAKLYVEVARGSAHAVVGDSLNETLLPIYQEAAAKPPAEIETLTLLADTYRDLGRKRDALRALQQAVEIDPANVDIILRCAELETALGQKASALKHYEEAYALSPGMSGVRETLGGLYLDNQRFEDAVRLFQEALAESPHNISLAISLSIALEGAHRPDEAEASFQQVFASDSCPVEAYLQLAVFQLARDEPAKAAATLAAAQTRFPNSAKVRFYEAIQHRYEKNYTAALDSLDQTRLLAVGPEAGVLDMHFYLECAMTMNLAGQKDRFEATLHEGLVKFPNSADLMNELAFFWADEGTHLTEALALSKRAVELEPDNGPIQDTRGWVSFQMGEAKDALPYLQRAAFLTNNDPIVMQHLGDAYLKLSLRSEAIAAWRHGLEKAPRNGDLANRIDAALAQAKNAHTRSAPTP